jgi:hypothetical protein
LSRQKATYKFGRWSAEKMRAVVSIRADVVAPITDVERRGIAVGFHEGLLDGE